MKIGDEDGDSIGAALSGACTCRVIPLFESFLELREPIRRERSHWLAEISKCLWVGEIQRFRRVVGEDPWEDRILHQVVV